MIQDASGIPTFPHLSLLRRTRFAGKRMVELHKIPSFIINHVFMPPKLPQEDDVDEENEQALCETVYEAAKEFANYLSEEERTHWNRIRRMLNQFLATHRTSSLAWNDVVRLLKNAESGDVLAFLIRAQNAGLIIRKDSKFVLFESFEVSPPNQTVMATKGRLLRSFPDTAIQFPIDVFEDHQFQMELARFLAGMDVHTLDSAPITTKSNTAVTEVRDTAHPRYITQLLTEILRGMGGEGAEVPHITKRIADDILWHNAYMPWRRSAIWLVLRVALQTTLVRQSRGQETYKEFVAFIHAKVLKLGLKLDQPSYLIACMQRKTARRLAKLATTTSPILLQFVRNVTLQAESLLKQRWEAAQVAQATSLNSTWAPDTLNIVADTALTLHNSREYILRSLEDTPSIKSSIPFIPKHHYRFYGAVNFAKSFNGRVAEAFKSDDSLTALADFERAVLIDLTDWATQNLLSSDAFISIATCVERYSATASSAYSSNPELLSVMLLTLFKLWVELDRIVIAQCPLLAKFSPEIPCALLNPLLLRTSKSIEALDYVEKYLRTRYFQAVSGQSVFSSTTGKSSFAGQFFDQSEQLQVLKTKIEEAAASQRLMKFQELRRSQKQYRDQMKAAEQYEHQYINKLTKIGKVKVKNAPQCPRCKLEKPAVRMKIDVHEWPLPQDVWEAKMVVFELAPPLPFSIWRKTTYMLLREVCIPRSSSFPKQPAYMQLQNYPTLAPYHTPTRHFPRIVLASTTKSFVKSHYKAQKVSAATEESILVKHGLKWTLFDSARSEWVTQQVTQCSLDGYCTLQLPPGRYQTLQYAVSGTSHTSNDIMAIQTECPRDVTLHEFMAFTRIRSGPRLQWLNIVSELRAGHLTFQDEAVYTLLRQAICQVGPSGLDGRREWHIEPTEWSFGEILLNELQDLLIKMKANWRNIIGMQVITTLVSRLLASTMDGEVVERGFSLMRDVRSVTYGWLNKLVSTLGDFEDEDRLRECQMHICEVAATCRATYNVDLDRAPALLSDTEDIAIFIHCGILFTYNSPANAAKADARFRDILYRDRRLAHAMEPLISQSLAESNEGLDQSILRIWKFYRPSFAWRRLPSPNDRWATTSTAPQGIQQVQIVHIDLLSGQLLIDGKPLGRLPESILTHISYTRIFGKKFMDVIPADMPGMDFKTSIPIGTDANDNTSGYQIYFALRQSPGSNDPGHLVIRAQRDMEIHELIPHEVFKHDLPTVLVETQTHWLNISTFKGEIEIRDLKTWWKPSSNNWRINFSPTTHSSMHRVIDNSSKLLMLIDPRSPTMSMISTNLRPLEDPENLLVTYSGSSGQLAVSLPRFGLDFFLNPQESCLESISIPGMIVDTDQSSNTMIGLKSQLILRSKDSLEPCLRQIIIPYTSAPQFTISSLQHHNAITLIIGDQPAVRYFMYTINSTLGRLDGDGTMLSKLYQIYLHALTSHCLPDPLTGRTGTEEALEGLRSARMMSFQRLGEDERRMLQQISELTPTRIFYPSHLKVMETVGWSKQAICPLAQHHGFYVLAKSIWQYAETLSGLTHSWDGAQMDLTRTSDHLLHRAARHSNIFYRHHIGFPVHLHSDSCDTLYHSRGRYIYTMCADEGVVFNVAAMVSNWDSKLPTHDQLFDALAQYGTISGVAREFSLEYGREWLEGSVAKMFLSACNACRAATKAIHRYQIAFSLSACAYASADIRPFVATIFAFAVIPELRALPPPQWLTFELSAGLEPNDDSILGIIVASTKQTDRRSKNSGKRQEKRMKALMNNQQEEIGVLMDILKVQWPRTKAPSIPNSREWVFDIPELEKQAASLYKNCLFNQDLYAYIDQVQQVLNKARQSYPNRATTLYTPALLDIRTQTAFDYPSFRQLVFQRGAPDVPSPPTPLRSSFESTKGVKRHNTDRLKDLLEVFRTSNFLSHQSDKPAAIQEQYADDLEASLQSLETEVEITSLDDASSRSQMLDVVRWRCYQRQCEQHLHAVYGLVQGSLSPCTESDQDLLISGLWPCLTTQSLLQALSFGSDVVLTNPWRKALNSFAQALLAFQHASRLTKYLHEKSFEEFRSEVENGVMEEDHDDESSSVQLLIQIDCNFTARQIQIDCTREMIAPSSQENTVLQLNMGEGKSSVIVPMVAAALSDGTKLVRVVVLRPLAPSMFQILVQRLSGLANRRVFYLPFSRNPRLTLAHAQKVQQMFSMCIQARGVLVVQPDHILSFKLMGLDRKYNTDPSKDPTNEVVADWLLESQRWLTSNSRDILDESDEILHVKYQLVYTVGQQQSVHGSPDRWIIGQQVLALVKKHVGAIHHSHPDGFEVVDDHSGGYPRIRILNDDAGAALIKLVAEDIWNGALDHCSFDLFPLELRSSVLSYITSLQVSSQDKRMLEEYCRNSDAWNTLLIVRGLLAHGILQFVLKEKRWRVDYGPDFSRSMMAVPYRAKDVPSLRAEFSHPDVAILLTCLSYYWQGLSQSQLEQCFDLLLKQDNPSMEYRKWVDHEQMVPEQLTHLGGIHLHDLDQRTELHNVFHRNHAAIDFFLSQIVFPRDAKEFPSKMATSGWDLAEIKDHVTTGFSGTNDGRYLLPTSIHHADPLSQSSTNAKVLMHLLRPENDIYHCVLQSNMRNSEQSLLHLLGEQNPEIRVLLDVGAQILKLSNEEVAMEWLKLNENPQVLAVVFFGSDDEPYVRTRNGMIEGLVSSPFRQRPEKCLLYLDDAHTRGTDFKLPSGTRAAVTLGPKVTKDRLVQGCMRMRMLGRGHTVMFFAPPEVDHSIRFAAGVQQNDRIRTKDIVLWTMFESCLEVLHRIPQWAQQGMDHRKREIAWRHLDESSRSTIDQLEEAWLQHEARSLDDTYALEQAGPMVGFTQQLEEFPDILTRYRKWAPASFTDTRFHEEQEREVVLEIETERQVEKPPTAVPAIHHVHDDVRQLVQKGIFVYYSSAFVPLFQPLGSSSFEGPSWLSLHLFSTKDFSVTVQSSQHGDYLRPVQWILSNAQPVGTVFVVLSPFEVNALLPDIRRSDKVHLHQYSPRITQEMKSFEDLAFHCIPALTESWTKPDLDLTIRLNLWAGQLYLEDETAYHHLCNFLGLYSWQPKEGDNIQPDGFIKPEHRHATATANSSFQNSPIPYLKRLFAARRKGMDYSSTHIGKILRGRLLSREDLH